MKALSQGQLYHNLYFCTMNTTRILAISAFMLAILCTSSCKRRNPSGIPYVPVNLQLTVSNPEFVNLQAVGGWVYIGGGSQGIIVFRASAEEFKAFDRHCTFQVDDICRLTVDETGNRAVDEDCCESKFLLFDGAPIEGPANLGLHQYNTQYNGNTLWITN